ncbi:MAG: B12-binding domain-containing radical SAM protein [Planctomycetes bacterium]|nr:B12-binding domain-containing radical SAM protein [Planctomycetota bacterium]
MADIVLVNPRFEVSYWGFEHALPLLRKRANLPTACLPLLAALTPSRHQVTLIDENVEEIDFERLAQADIVGLTGMCVQRERMAEILQELKRRGVFCVVGGPWVTVQEDYFGELTDVIFVGEAEETWPRFLHDWEAGAHAQRYEQQDRTDMTRVPVPRYDLLKMRHYMFGSVQFSRGCPFQCEFCDIIVTFGRRPRLKTSAQVLRELEALRTSGMTIAFVVDDNLIGSKQAIKQILREIAAWQQRNGFPLLLSTEASIDLADDEELMRLMTEANFITVFVGIETPNQAALRETRKFQNLRGERTLVEKVHSMQAAGLEVWCGLIVGFDHDDAGVFDLQRDFVERSRISHSMLGMLSAIPKTPLHARLVAEGRLDEEGHEEFGTNVVPALISREQLREGYRQLQRELHEPEAYFDRLDRLYLDGDFYFAQPRARYWRKHPGAWLRGNLGDLAKSIGVLFSLMLNVKDPHLRQVYRRRVLRLVRRRPDPAVIFAYVLKCVIHYHHYTMAQQMTNKESRLVNTF